MVWLADPPSLHLTYYRYMNEGERGQLKALQERLISARDAYWRALVSDRPADVSALHQEFQAAKIAISEFLQQHS
jgi:hypothetical protein